MMDFKIKRFTQLNTTEVYQLLKLRAQVFIVEQNCVYQDIDGKDVDAIHLLGFERNASALAAYARILYDQEKHAFRFGRLVTHPDVRGKGLGKQLLEQVMGYIKEHHPQKAVLISAQLYLTNFYNHYGFKSSGESYLEDGIPHIMMQYNG
jgi:ElaA protein